jgi:predicted TPR repeat methyltransferase
VEIALSNVRVPAGFDFHYFDDPDAYGYQGYTRRPYGPHVHEPWEEVTRLCVAREVRSAIDIGCAKGFLVEALLDQGIAARGFDVSEYALSFAGSLPCSRGDIREGISGCADAVIALGVLMYLTEDELPFALNEIARAAHKLFVFSSYYEGDRQLIPDPLRRITRSRAWWRAAIEAVGFTFEQRETYYEVYGRSGSARTP